MATHSSTTSDATVEGQMLPPIAELGPIGNKTPGTLEGWPLRTMLLAMVAAIGVLQYVTPLTAAHWLYIIQRLYFIPIVFAALNAGWRGGLTVGLLAGAAFAIGTPAIWVVRPVDMLDQGLQICVFCMVGTVAGLLSDRQRRQELTLRRTSVQLDQAHRELRENFEAMKRAERLYALGQLSAGLAHEIRNPLASIEGAAAVVQRERESEERRREFLEIIQKECRRLNQLLTSFLNFARPSPPDLKTVEIDRLLDSVMVLAQHAGDTSQCDLKKDIQPGLSRLECDPEQMKQVLLNLVMNAIQATPQGGAVTLAAQENGDRVEIDVHDQGCGIRARLSRSGLRSLLYHQRDGHRLGTVCGAPDCEPTWGDADRGSQLAPWGHNAGFASPSSESQMNTGRILVVDDDESLRRVLQVQLEQDGYSVVSAASAQQAFSLLQLRAYDLVITDLKMPGLSGMDVLKQVKSQYPEYRRHCPHRLRNRGDSGGSHKGRRL